MADKSKGKSKSKLANDEQLVELLLRGGPRVSSNAYSELSRRNRDGHDVVRLLPSPDGLERVQRHRVFSLMRRALIQKQDTSGLLNLLVQQTENEVGSSLLDWGNTVKDPAMVSVLVEKVIELLGSTSADIAAHAAYALSHWCSEACYQPWDSAVDFSAILTDRRKSKSFPQGIGRTLMPGFGRAALRSERAPEVLAAWLAHQNKEVRRMAAELETGRSLGNERRDEQGVREHLARFLGHRDRAIRAGASQYLERCTSSPERAEQILLAAFAVPDQKVRSAVANAVAKALEPRFKPSKEVAEAIKRMSAPDLALRQAAAGACAGYLIDAVDCRSAAPHFAMALPDPDPKVSENAALSLSYAFDMQGNLDIVRVTLPCLRAARATASGETAEHLDAALADASRRAD